MHKGPIDRRENSSDGETSDAARKTSARKTNARRVRRIGWFVSLVAAVVVLVTMGTLRWYGYVTAEDYSWPVIVGNALVVGGIVPLMFWIADRPGMDRVFQVIGGLILLGVIPAILIWLLIEWLTGIPLF